MRNIILPAIVLASIAATGAQASTTVNGTMAVGATVATGCTVAAQPLAFGTISQLNGAAADSQTQVTVTCTPGITYNVGMDQGTNSSDGTRHMKSLTSAATIPYLLYSNASRTTAWGNSVGSDTVQGTSTTVATTLDVYGRIPVNAPKVASGVYADSVTVTVSF